MVPRKCSSGLEMTPRAASREKLRHGTAVLICVKSVRKVRAGGRSWLGLADSPMRADAFLLQPMHIGTLYDVKQSHGRTRFFQSLGQILPEEINEEVHRDRFDILLIDGEASSVVFHFTRMKTATFL